MLLQPLFDNVHNLNKNHENVILPVRTNLESKVMKDDFIHTLAFLKSYAGSIGTFNSYRRETERLLQWAWLIKKVSIRELKRDDMEQFIKFCQNPPTTWINTHKVPRYLENAGQRKPNPDWRPFVVTISKIAHKLGKNPNVEQFALSQGAIQEIFAILSTYFNFLVAEEYLIANPVALIRQKSKFIRRQQQKAPIRRLSLLQWQTVLDVTEELILQDPVKYERTLFILSLLFGMYLRISELAATDRWTPRMNNFTKDSYDQWWFTTVGKGNKERQIAVSDSMLGSLIRWRIFLGLSRLPTPADTSPLLPKLRGRGPLSDTVPIRRLVQECFDRACEKLQCAGKQEEADNLAAATVHC